MNLFDIPFKNDETSQRELNDLFVEEVNKDTDLKNLRDFVESTAYGFGERSFYWMWKLIVDELPQNFNFLEIGVYRGQILALVNLLNKRENKNGKVIGISPMNSADGYIEKDYWPDIQEIHKIFDLPSPMILKGYSTDKDIIKQSFEEGLYDVIYIDGSHESDIVEQDILNYTPLIKKGGFLVMDDCSNKIKMPNGYFRGHERVSKVVDKYLPPFGFIKNDFKFLFNIVHNRVWQKQ